MFTREPRHGRLCLGEVPHFFTIPTKELRRWVCWPAANASWPVRGGPWQSASNGVPARDGVLDLFISVPLPQRRQRFGAQLSRYLLAAFLFSDSFGGLRSHRHRRSQPLESAGPTCNLTCGLGLFIVKTQDSTDVLFPGRGDVSVVPLVGGDRPRRNAYRHIGYD